MPTMHEIEKLTASYRAERDRLSESVQTLNSEILDCKRRHINAIRRAVSRAANAKGLLQKALSESSALFVKPRTKTFSGVRVGMKKRVGKLQIADPENTIRLIKKHHPDLVAVLIATTETVIKGALAELPGSDLKRLGVAIEDDVDEIYIKETDSEIDKLVDALMADQEDTEQAA